MDFEDPHQLATVSKPQTQGLHDLPSEILFLVFWLLHGQDIARCLRVSRRIADVIHSDVYLQYRIELAKNGMVDGPSSTLPVAERLQRLRQYSSNFRNGIFDYECNTDYTEYICHLLSLNCRGRSRTAGVTTVFHVDTDSGQRKNYLAVFIDPSRQAGIQSRRFVIPMGNPEDQTRAVDGGWIIDRAQDLFVTLETVYTGTNTQYIELHLSSWNGSQVRQMDHPAATVPHLQILPLPGYPGDPAGVMQIRSTVIGGSYIAWQFFLIMPGHVYNHSIFACKWRTGEIVSHIDFGEKDQSFVLLDDAYILATPRQSDSDSEPHLSVYDLAPSSSNQPICSLQLPSLPLRPGERIVYLEICTSRQPPAPEGHFHDDPSVSMVVLTYSFEDENWTKSRVCYLVIPSAVLLARIRTAVSSSSDPDADLPMPPVPVPWQDWGALASLRLWVPVHPHRYHITDDLSLVPYGSRMPIVMFDDAGCTRLSVYVFDLNPLVVRHARAALATRSSSNSNSGSGVDLGATAIVEDVEAALPGVVDPECSAVPFVVYRFEVPLPEEEHYAWRMVQAVRMSMTGFTVTFGEGPHETDHTWTV